MSLLFENADSADKDKARSVCHFKLPYFTQRDDLRFRKPILVLVHGPGNPPSQFLSWLNKSPLCILRKTVQMCITFFLLHSSADGI